jgi:outer membrane murein-binding lipoprotein Lpp
MKKETIVGRLLSTEAISAAEAVELLTDHAPQDATEMEDLKTQLNELKEKLRKKEDEVKCALKELGHANKRIKEFEEDKYKKLLDDIKKPHKPFVEPYNPYPFNPYKGTTTNPYDVTMKNVPTSGNINHTSLNDFHTAFDAHYFKNSIENSKKFEESMDKATKRVKEILEKSEIKTDVYPMKNFVPLRSPFNEI